MAWYTRSRLFVSALERPSRRRMVRLFGAATAVSLLVAIAQGAAAATAEPAGADRSTGATAPVPADPTSQAAAEAAATGAPAEVEGSQTANSTTYLNPDGTSSVVITQTPTRTEQDGEFVDIDPSLSKTDGVLAPSATTADVQITDGVGDGAAHGEPLAQVAKGKNSLALDWSADLPKASVDGSTATFDVSPTKDLEVTATNAGFNVHVVLDQAPNSAPVYRLPVTAKGVHLVATNGGGFAAEDPTGKAVFHIAPPMMWDHTQDSAEAGPEQTVPVASTLTEDADGTQVLELRPDYAWLSDSARVWPVTVDPDVYVDSMGAQSTYVSSNTTWNNSASPHRADINYAAASMTRTGYNPSAGWDKTRTYLQPVLPARVGGQVVSATLRLYEYDATSCTKTPMTIYPIDHAWDASTITWNHRPSTNTASPYAIATQTFTHGYSTSCGNGSEDFNVKPLVEQWMNYTPGVSGIPYFGMTLAADDTDPNSYKGFCSFNANTSGSGTSCTSTSRQPTLTITYNTPPSINNAISKVTPSSCETGSNPLVPTLVPSLKATATDPDTRTGDGLEPLTVTFEIWPQDAAEASDLNALADPSDPSSGPAITRITTGAVTGNQGTELAWPVPSGILTDGGLYAWRAQAKDDGGATSAWSAWRTMTVDTATPLVSTCAVDAAGIQDAAVVAAQSNTTTTAAIQNIGWQDDFSQLADALEASYPDAFAGGAVDEATTNKAWVGFSGTAPAAARSQIQAFVSKVSPVTTVTVAIIENRGFSAKNLVQFADDLASNLASDNTNTAVVEPDIAAGQINVALGVGDGVTQQQAEDAVAGQTPMYPATSGSPRSFTVNVDTAEPITVTQTRNSVYGGGTTFDPNTFKQECTTAFTVRQWTTGKRGISTAGHCAENYPSLLYNNSPESLAVNQSTLYRQGFRDGDNGDMAWYSNSTSNFKDNFFYGGSKSRDVVGAVSPAKGSKVCTYGRRTLQQLVNTVDNPDYTIVSHGQKLSHIVSTKQALVAGGDSGGPWYACGSGWAEGITIGSAQIKYRLTPWRNKTFDIFTNVAALYATLGVDVATS